jgi:hypothetical protein
MRVLLNEDLALAELNLGRAQQDEVEVEKVLDFAENFLLNTGEAWQESSLEQKQRLQQLRCPRGVEYADGLYRTQETSFLFKGLHLISTSIAAGRRGSLFSNGDGTLRPESR